VDADHAGGGAVADEVDAGVDGGVGVGEGDTAVGGAEAEGC